MTNRLAATLGRVTSDLARYGRRFALVGGVAVSVRAEPRLTRDVDLAVAVTDDADAERLIRSFVTEGYETAALVEQEGTRRLATIRLIAPGGEEKGIVADVLFASSGIESEIVAAAEPVAVFSGLVVPVARVGHLVALKLLARDDRRRPQDADDLRALRRVATDDDVAIARAAVRLISARGFGRGRDVVQSLNDWLAET